MLNTLYKLSKSDTQIIKGVAILVIVAHNFTHSLTNVGVNEMGFELDGTLSLFRSIADNPLGIINDIITYFGAYGVQLFIFISAYGLTKKHMNVGIPSYLKFILDRLVKIYGLLFMGLIFYFVFQLRILPFEQYVNVTLKYIFMTSNLHIDSLFSFVGPWWFFSLIVQLYILYPFLFWLIHKYKGRAVVILLVLSYLVIYPLYMLEDVTRYPVFGNAIGHLPEFIFGICAAMFPSVKIDRRITIIALLIFIGSCFLKVIFPLGFLAATIVILSCIQSLFKISKSNYIIRFFIFLGNISMFIFVINGVVRFRTWRWMHYYTDDSPLQILLFCIVHTLLVIGISYVVYRIYKEIAIFLKKRVGIAIL